MNQFNILSFLNYLIILLFTFSCSASMAKQDTAPAGRQGNFRGGLESGSVSSSKTEIPLQPRIVTYNADLIISLKKIEFDSSIKKIIKHVLEKKGYIISQNLNYISFKIPSSEFFEIVEFVKATGKVESEYLSSKDITEEFYDTQIRLENAEKMQKRLSELLKKANVKEAIEIEVELNKVTNQIDSLKSKMNLYQNLINYSTISVSFREAEVLGPLGWVFYGAYRAIRFLFYID